MKDNLFEMLLTLFEKTLTQLKENSPSKDTDDLTKLNSSDENVGSESCDYAELTALANCNSIRVFSSIEQTKLTKSSYQFLMRLSSWQVIGRDMLEQIIDRLIFSDSDFVTLQETKWMVRNTLADVLDAEQLAFLDLVLYHKEDELPLH